MHNPSMPFMRAVVKYLRWLDRQDESGDPIERYHADLPDIRLNDFIEEMRQMQSDIERRTFLRLITQHLTFDSYLRVAQEFHFVEDRYYQH